MIVDSADGITSDGITSFSASSYTNGSTIIIWTPTPYATRTTQLFAQPPRCRLLFLKDFSDLKLLIGGMLFQMTF